MEFDPESNMYSSNGPSTRLKNAERDIRRLKAEVKELRGIVEALTDRVDSHTP